jgi:hypothetical protein
MLRCFHNSIAEAGMIHFTVVLQSIYKPLQHSLYKLALSKNKKKSEKLNDMKDKYKKNKGKIIEIGYGTLWALITAIIAFIVLFFSGYALSELIGTDVDIAAITAYILYDLIIGTASYFICRKYPGSILVVPVFANVMGIISSFAEDNFWTSDLWILIVSGWILSIGASLAGYFIKTRSA